ncbi:MAG: hypothetical protein LBS09_03120 [Bacteroidales bacterium]|jgi:hypothetical protein|nr:hypothetical protein [Bacteroidales bacterium]
MRVFTCKACAKIHVEAGNVLFHFSTPEKLEIYLEYLESIDVSYYATVNRKKGLKKVIILPMGDLPVNLAFTEQEFELLKEIIQNYLATDRSKKAFVTSEELQQLNLN